MKQVRHQVKVYLTLEFHTTEEDSEKEFESAYKTIESVLGNSLYELDGKYGILTMDQEWK